MATTLQPSALLEARLRARQARVAVLGLGYAGLPMAVACAEAGYPVLGLDVDPVRVATLSRGTSPIPDVPETVLAPLVRSTLLQPSTNMALLAEADVVLVAVPTPLTPERTPELRYVHQAAASIATYARPGQLVLLQSTCGPGTTRDALGGRLAARGLTPGLDLHLAHAPERIDPGNRYYTVRNTPKLVGGVSPRCTELAALFFAPLVDQVIPCPNPEVAELSKLVENTFRFVNVSLVNEVARLCDQLGVDVWAVLDAAATKPFAYLPHRPGAGVGGHCIPIVPFYLADAARGAGIAAELVEAAGRVNATQPRWLVDKLERLLGERGQPLDTTRVLLVGMAYKPEVGDLREAASLQVLDELLVRGAQVAYHDPWVPSLCLNGREWHSVPLDDLGRYAAALVLTPHAIVDYARVAAGVPLVLDATNALAPLAAPNVVPL